MRQLVGISYTPLKGARHQPLTRARITPAGIAGDREFALVAGERVPSTAKQKALLQATFSVLGEGIAELALPGGEVVRQELAASERRDVDYWGRTLTVEVLPGPISAAASDLLGTPLELARVIGGRAIYAERVSVLFHSELADLPPAAQDPAVYRMNLVVDDRTDPIDVATASGTTLRLGTITLRLGQRMPRCVVVNHLAGRGTIGAIGRLQGGEPLIGFGAHVIAEGSSCRDDVVEVGAAGTPEPLA